MISFAVPILAGWGNTTSKVIVDNLRAFEEKLRAHGIPANKIHRELGTAIYTVCELQAYVTGNRSDVVDQKTALEYRDFL